MSLDAANLLEHGARWMIARGWRGKLAKHRGYEQSLLEHSLIEIDVLLALLPILSSPLHYGFTEAEQKILAVAVLTHDVGKETDTWQAYITGQSPGNWVGHIFPELTAAVVPEVCTALEFPDCTEPVQSIMAHCAAFHHNRPGRSDAAIVEAMLSGGTDRFLTLASLVKGIDHLASAASASEAEHAIVADPALGSHLRTTRHDLAIRGVSTTFVHRAAETAFTQLGWVPLLYFSNATLYVADPSIYSLIPSLDEVRNCLKGELDTAVARDVTSIIVGSPTGNILPKPDLLSFGESRLYLESAAGKISPASFARKSIKDKRKVVERYWKLQGRSERPDDSMVEQEAGRISVAQPEMIVFKFFKAMVDPGKVREVGKDGAALAAQLYEHTFGAGSWAALQSTANLMPDRDMANSIDLFWRIPGAAVGHPEVTKVAELPSELRMRVLIDLLDGIAQQVYSAVDGPSPRDRLPDSMASAFLRDLLQPTDVDDIRATAEQQLSNYGSSKRFAGTDSTKGIYLCPICNQSFDRAGGVKASADFIDNPQTHTNRGVAYGTFGYVMVCTTCYYERLLIQVLLGNRPAEIITLMPRLNLGRAGGERLVRKVRQWIEAANALALADFGKPELGFSLGFVDQAARHLRGRDPFALDSAELLDLFSYRFSDDTQKKRKRETMKRIKEEFDDDLAAVNSACGQSFASWENVADSLIENRIQQQDLRSIRRDVFRLYETIDLICRTPNLVFVPLRYAVATGDEESETNKGLRRLYVALILSIVFDAAVVIHKEGEYVDFAHKAGTAYVPPVPAVRALIGQQWVPIPESRRWLTAIGAASELVRDTGLPERSALYQILSADPPERLARRIEETMKRELSARHLQLIEELPKFRRQLGKEE